MKTNTANGVDEVKVRLVEVGGRATQDLGMGRIVGQVLACVYLSEDECSLDDIAVELGLSKAAVSIAARQLESFGVLERVWKKGDRKNYYRVVDHLGLAVQKGILAMARAKVETVGMELQRADETLKEEGRSNGEKKTRSMHRKVKRARDVCKLAQKLLENPIVRLLTRKSV